MLLQNIIVVVLLITLVQTQNVLMHSNSQLTYDISSLEVHPTETGPVLRDLRPGVEIFFVPLVSFFNSKI